MKNKKGTMYISAVIAIIGIVGFIILQFRFYELIGIFGGTEFLSNLRQLGIVITSGLFTSALVTFLISVGEYKNERLEALENMYLAAEDLEREFLKIKYFLPDEPQELVLNVLGELDNNENSMRFNKHLAESVLQLDDQQKADELYSRNCLKLNCDAKKLMNENNMQELNDYLGGELTQKHYIEKCIHNMASYSMPSTVQENANNAYDFLERLKREKEAEMEAIISI